MPKPEPPPVITRVVDVKDPGGEFYSVYVRMPSHLASKFPDKPWGTAITGIGLAAKDTVKFEGYTLVGIEGISGRGAADSPDLFWIFEKLDGPTWTTTVKSRNNLTPEKFRDFVTTTKTKQDVDPGTTPTTLTGDLVSSAVERQDNTGKSVKTEVTETINEFTAPLISPIVGEQRYIIRETYVNEGTPADEGFGIVESAVMAVGNGKATKTTKIAVVSYDPEADPTYVVGFTSRVGNAFDSRYGVPIGLSRIKVDATAALPITNPSIAGGVVTVVAREPNSVWHANQETRTYTLPSDQIWWGSRRAPQLPRVLKGIELIDGNENPTLVPIFEEDIGGLLKARWTRKFTFGPPDQYFEGRIYRPSEYTLLAEYGRSSVTTTDSEGTSSSVGANTSTTTNTSDNSTNSISSSENRGTSSSTQNSTNESTSDNAGSSTSNTTGTSDTSNTGSSTSSNVGSSTSSNVGSSTSSNTGSSTSSSSGSSTSSNEGGSTSDSTGTGSSTNLTTSDSSNKTTSESSNVGTSSSDNTGTSSSESRGGSQSGSTGKSSRDGESTTTTVTNTDDRGQPLPKGVVIDRNTTTTTASSGESTNSGGSNTVGWTKGNSASASTRTGSSTNTGTGSSTNTGTGSSTSDGTSTSSRTSSGTSTSSGNSTSKSSSETTTSNAGSSTSDSSSSGTSDSSTDTTSSGTGSSTSSNTGESTSSNSGSSTSSGTNQSTSVSNNAGISETSSNTESAGTGESNTTSTSNYISSTTSTSAGKSVLALRIPSCLRTSITFKVMATTYTIPATSPTGVERGTWVVEDIATNHWQDGIWVTETVEVYLPALPE